MGFDLLMVSDHVAVTPDVAQRYPAPFYEPFTTLSWLAGVTGRVTLGTTVLVARMAANLSELSGDRFLLGVAGYRAGHIPIWVGGHSDCALRRGDAGHPLRQTPEGWQESLTRLRKVAQEDGRPLPALTPRIALRLTDAPLGGRLLGEGTVEQVVGDLERLRVDGARAVVLDPYFGDPDQTQTPEVAWRALATVRKERVRKESQ